MYVCAECGYDSVKWLGKCPGCGAWNTLNEEIITETDDRSFSVGAAGNSKAISIENVEVEDLPRFSAGSTELNRVLGGGIIPGSLTLIVGDPGVGKSTLTLATSATVARGGKKVLYVTGEESARQVRMRADRLNAVAENLFVVSETNLSTIENHIENIKPNLVIMDSIQTVFRPELDSAPGSVSQVRECAVELLRIAKSMNIAIFIIGHVTKDGTLAGPRVLEHIVDTVLYFEGERHASYRVLRAVKNRFGSTNELGLFEMRESGLKDVPDASKLFLSDRTGDAGTVVIPVMEGARPLLVEVQALAAQTPFVPPRRTSDSIDIKSLQLLLAVLEKRVHLPLGTCDVYVKVAGGIKIDEPAADLGVCAAIASSFTGRALRERTILFGEVGLSGELRAVGQAEARLAEARRLGFKCAVLPKKNLREVEKNFTDMKLYGAEILREALSLALPKEG